MKYKYKVSLIAISFLLVISLCITSSYAIWVYSVSQESTNVVVTDCFELRFSNENHAINLEYAFPMEDRLGVQTKPFEFTVTNICNHAADIQINLETLNGSTLDSSNIKTDLNGKVLAVEDATSITPTLDNVIDAVKLDEYTLEANSSKKFNLRLWVKEDAVQNEIENTTYSSKVTISAVVRKKYDVATLKKGTEFNIAIKTLAGDNNPTQDTVNTSIKSIERSLAAPAESDNAVLVSTNESSKLVYAWFKNETIYIYSEADKIYMNENSSFLFRYLSGLTLLDLSYFDTSNVINMYGIFSYLSNVSTLNLSNFDTSNVTNMDYMFYSMNALTSLDLSKFNTSKVTSMSNMFSKTTNMTSLDISHFDTSKVTDMQGMFNEASALTSLDVSHFDTSNVINMNNMFRSMSNLTSIDLNEFNTSNVTDMNNMFNGMSNIVALDVSYFNTSKVANMSNMFSNMSNLTSLNVSDFDTSNVTNMNGMFYNLINLTYLNISGFNTSKVTNMGSMFSSMKELTNLDVSHFDTSKVINMGSMFYGMRKITSLDISSFDTSRVTRMGSMFKDCVKLKTIYVGNNWNISNLDIEDGQYDYQCGSRNMFGTLTSIVGQEGTTYDSNHVDRTYAHVDEGPSNPGYLTLKTN